MQELEDIRLLRQYTENDSEEAFCAIVSRHINKVYSTALRHTRNPSEAEEITQAVFVILAKKARDLSNRVILSGWLYQTARLASVTFLKSEIRRARREQEAHTMQSILNEPDETWMEIAPLLDAAMANLNDADRNAVVLRFFDGKSIKEVGTALGTTEDTAKKRVSRALEKLQRFFARRGVSSTAAIIAGTISSNSVKAAPDALAKSVTAVAMAKGLAASASTLTLLKGVSKAMSLQKIKIAAVVGAFVVLAAGTTTLGVEKVAKPNSSVPYRMADDIYRLVNSVDTNRVGLGLVIFPMNKAVRPENICFTIHSAIKGPILFRPSTNGFLALTNFPDDAVLRRENPIVTANQPFDSILIIPWVFLSVPKERTFNYSVLIDDIDEASRAFAKLNKIVTPGNVGWINYIRWLFMGKPNVDGVAFVFPKADAKKAILKIQTASNTWTYQADAAGVITFKLNSKSLPEKAQISLSERPLSIGMNYSFGNNSLSPFSMGVHITGE